MSAAYFDERRAFDRLASWRPDTLATWRASMAEAQHFHRLARSTATQRALAEQRVVEATAARLAHPIDGRERIAFHEAGHAVVNIAFSFGVSLVSIRREEKPDGRVRLGVTFTEGCGVDDSELIRRRIAAIAAGRTAELLAQGRTATTDDLENSDAAAGQRHSARMAALTGRDAFAELHSGLCLARTILSMPATWDKVVTIAAALLEKNELQETEIDELL